MISDKESISYYLIDQLIGFYTSLSTQSLNGEVIVRIICQNAMESLYLTQAFFKQAEVNGKVNFIIQLKKSIYPSIILWSIGLFLGVIFMTVFISYSMFYWIRSVISGIIFFKYVFRTTNSEYSFNSNKIWLSVALTIGYIVEVMQFSQCLDVF